MSSYSDSAGVAKIAGMDEKAQLTIAQLNDRITELESSLAHHQREYDLLNQVVIEHAEVVSKLDRKLKELETTLKSVEVRIPEERDLAEEKPPHY